MKVLRPKLGKARIIALKDKEGKELRHINEIEETIKEFYSNLYESKQNATYQTEQMLKKKILNVNSEDMAEIEEEEIISALTEMKNNKSPGKDDMTKELLRDGGESVTKILKTLYKKCLETGTIPRE